MKKPGAAGFVILALAALGIVQILMNPSITWLIPIVIIAVVALLYFFLPNSRRPGGFRSTGGGRQPKIKPSARTQEKMARMSSSGSAKAAPARPGKAPALPAKNPKKRKNYPFQVIEGRKGKDEDDIPKFH
ncbi:MULTISPECIES: DUF2207 domain-containing protein [Saccharibacillus]|uniref:DUF2207 domain-containing protein n=1 Tax=Saccharibacillus brassicae TaxID=2583377 RepID=A0A4Y6UPM6_SACBS|nr:MULTISPECIES: DUF2207 domain-containing protein [Saccharibacillus]MWJ31763.1 hypothetical protein [Saccharibacillus sp. WB 17]QDH19609.1 DUF2207 domain-containing protein [Saccharibacillus brassicae]